MKGLTEDVPGSAILLGLYKRGFPRGFFSYDCQYGNS
jgi:hypothetical protein